MRDLDLEPKTMVNALRTLAALREALDEDGLTRDSNLNGAEMTGWLEPNRMGSTGFSVRPLPDGDIEWHIVVSGRKHLDYQEREQEEIPYDEGDPETVTLHEPTNPEILAPRIGKAFAAIGVSVSSVKATDWQTMWDDDVGYTVRSEWPEWLKRPDSPNAWTWPDSPVLVSLIPRSEARLPRLDGNLVGYRVGAELYLTRESMERIAAQPAPPPPARGYGFGYRQSLPRTSAYDASAEIQAGADKRLRNHWGDEVEAWRATRDWFEIDARFKPAVSFFMDGEVRSAAGFREIDAQFGDDAPWIREPTATPGLR